MEIIQLNSTSSRVKAVERSIRQSIEGGHQVTSVNESICTGRKIQAVHFIFGVKSRFVYVGLWTEEAMIDTAYFVFRFIVSFFQCGRLFNLLLAPLLRIK